MLTLHEFLTKYGYSFSREEILLFGEFPITRKQLQDLPDTEVKSWLRKEVRRFKREMNAGIDQFIEDIESIVTREEFH